MAGTCSVCGGPTRFNTFKCGSCKKANRSAPSTPPATAPILDETLKELTPLRFAVRRIEAQTMVFSVVDTLTGTIREITNDPLDAADICGQLNNDIIYALGKRWRAPE